MKHQDWLAGQLKDDDFATRLTLFRRNLEARKPQGLEAAQRTDRAALV